MKTTVLDMSTGQKLRIQSKYLFGADGARSEVVEQIGLPMTEYPSLGVAYNVIIEADMSNIMKYSPGLIHNLLQPDKEHPDYAWQGVARMVKPWHEWQFTYFPVPGLKEVTATDEDWARRTREFIGDDSVEVKVKRVFKWRINESYANEYASGNM